MARCQRAARLWQDQFCCISGVPFGGATARCFTWLCQPLEAPVEAQSRQVKLALVHADTTDQLHYTIQDDLIAAYHSFCSLLTLLSTVRHAF